MFQLSPDGFKKMAKFSSPKNQAKKIMKQLQGKHIASVCTAKNYETELISAAKWIKTFNKDPEHNGLFDFTPELAREFLEYRAEFVVQNTLNVARLALESMLHFVLNNLAHNKKLTVIKAVKYIKKSCRYYTNQQVYLIKSHQREKQSFATELAYSAGLRAHELFTIRTLEEQPPDKRPMLKTKFLGRKGILYTVKGKGGLIRTVLVPYHISLLLEDKRLSVPIQKRDRTVFYNQYYNISGGQNWSNTFSAASQRALNWSRGAHGLRHSYARDRMNELLALGLSREESLETVSQELGHFRPEITETYLR